MLNYIIDTVKNIAGHEYLYFDLPVMPKWESPVSIFIWGICVSPFNQVYVMDSEQDWHEVKEIQSDEELIIRLYERLKIYKSRYNKAS